MCRRGCFCKHFDKLIIKQWIISSCNHCYYFRDVRTANKDKATRSHLFSTKVFKAMRETDLLRSWEELCIDLYFLIFLWFSSFIGFQLNRFWFILGYFSYNVYLATCYMLFSFTLTCRKNVCNFFQELGREVDYKSVQIWLIRGIFRQYEYISGVVYY